MSSESSSSGAITSSFENISDVFTSYSEIPSSGFNCLYKAQRYGKWFVLKGLKPEYRNQGLYLELLAKEFELGMKMDHPHIAHTFSKENDPVAGPCMVMEYVDGMTLREFLETKPDAKTRLNIVRELLSAIAYYHNLQIIHRDLKPDNILITRNGHNVKLIDFGLADSDYHGILKQPAGTNRYAAPEQTAGNMPIDLRADLYAFGIILPQIFPNRYRAIARKCTRADREKRFSNAEEILRRLQRQRTLVPLLIIAAIFTVTICLLGLFLSHYQINNKEKSSLESAQNSIQLLDSVTHDSITTLHDTIVIVSVPKADKAKMFIDEKLKTIYAPFWSYYREVSIDSTQSSSELWFESFNAIPPKDSERNKAIIDEVITHYPEYATKRGELEQYLESCDKSEREKAVEARMLLFKEE